MKNNLLKSILIALSGLPYMAFSQIPNPDFELWDSVTLNRPAGFLVYGQTTKVPGYKSANAVRIQKNMAISEGPGAIIYGNPNQNFSGGIPSVSRPDSAVVFLKYHLVSGDTAWFLVYFKRDGHFISQDVFKFHGSDTMNFKRLAFAIQYRDTGLSDSLVVGISSSNPNEALEGSFVIADSVHFVGGTGKVLVPNGNFEQWNIIGFNNLRSWLTTNSQAPDNVTLPVSKTKDHAYTTTACKIQNVPSGSGDFIMGYIMAGKQGNDGPEPGFPVQGRDSVLYCSYKCFPQGDTINIVIMMFRQGQMMGMGRFTQSYTIDVWSQVAIPIVYWNASDAPDSAVIYCSAFNGGSNPHGNTILYVDGLNLNRPRTELFTRWLLPANVYPNPASNRLNIVLPAGSGEITSVRLTDINGRKVDVKFIICGNSVSIDTDSLADGIWIYEIASAEGMRKGRVVIRQ